MAENVYEGLFLLDANRYARDGAKVARQVEQLIKAAGGQLVVSRLWDERRLAYPIKKHRKGAYWLSYFSMAPDGVSTLNRQCQISDLILRHLVLKVDPRIVDAVVRHVQDRGKPGVGEGSGSKTGPAEGQPAVATADVERQQADTGQNE